MTTEKKKKKVQQQAELIGSADYIANHEIDQIIKKGRDRIKHAITISDEKLTKTKKEIVREMALQLEKANYPVNQICDRLSKSLKSLVNDRTVRDALESKYKDQSQSQVAAAQNYDGGSLYRQEEQLRKKNVKEITFDDLKLLNNLTKVKQVAKHQMQKAEWWEQQAKQNKAAAVTTPTKQAEDKDKIIEDLRKEIKGLKNMVKVQFVVYKLIRDKRLSDAEIGKMQREGAAEWMTQYQGKAEAYFDDAKHPLGELGIKEPEIKETRPKRIRDID